MVKRVKQPWDRHLEQKRKRQEFQDAVNEGEARRFLENPVLSASDLSRPALRRVLTLKGVPEKESDSILNRQELIKRVQEVVGDDQERIRLGLDRRSSEQKKCPSRECSFHRLQTSVLLFISSFLDQTSLARLACVHAYLRVRLSLGLNGTPSLTLAYPRHWLLSCKLSRNQMILLLHRISRSGSVSVSFTMSENTKRSRRLLNQLQACDSLVELNVAAINRYSSILTFYSDENRPLLRTLRVINLTRTETLDYDALYSLPSLGLGDFLEECTSLVSLTIENWACHLPALVETLCALKHLAHLKLTNLICWEHPTYYMHYMRTIRGNERRELLSHCILRTFVVNLSRYEYDVETGEVLRTRDKRRFVGADTDV